ncbi:uncharacterized protein LOC134527430 [Bacillus rossius redtenbacheri]|uniref:uncharacterized protein LOC134527430 n=1 Tax=Bacillus rossius redtenbacheri TaxID=93214 RepID=UPI002FDDD756
MAWQWALLFHHLWPIIFMEIFEQDALSKSNSPPKIWLRYVDDTFTVWQHGLETLEEFVNHLNSLRPSIKFTYEKETNGSIPFLDVLVSRKNNSLETKVYRKPTHTGQYLNFASNHPKTTKTGIIHTLTNRAEIICSDEKSIAVEHNHIKKELIANGYPANTIKQHMKSNKTLKPTETDKPAGTLVIPYVQGLSEKIRHLGNKYGLKTAFRSKSTIKSIVTKVKPATEKLQTHNCVYQIPCECGHVYIGETGRALSTRIKEHKNNCKKGETLKSRLAEHTWENSHKILWEDSTPLIQEPDKIKRKIK